MAESAKARQIRRKIIAGFILGLGFLAMTIPLFLEMTGQSKFSKPTATTQPTPAADPEKLRERLRVSYQDALRETAPNLNYIKVKIVKTKDGYELCGNHSFFGRYSFDAGPLALGVSQWYRANQADLKASAIVRVGVGDDRAKSSETYFDIK